MGYMKKFYFIVIMLLGVMIMPSFVKADELTSVDLTGVNKPTAPGQVTFSGDLTTESAEKFTIVGQAWGELIIEESGNTFEYVGSKNNLIPGAVTLSHGGKTYTPDQIENDSYTYSVDKHVLYYVVVLSKDEETDTYGENIAVTIGGEAQSDVKKVVNGDNVYLYVMSYSATVQGDEYVFTEKEDGVFNISYTEGTDLTVSASACDDLQDTEICKFLYAYHVGSELSGVDAVYLIKKDSAYSISTSATPGTGETQYLKITKKGGNYVITPLVKEDFTVTKSSQSFLVKAESITGSSTAKKYYVDEYTGVSFKFKYTEASSEEEGGKGDAEEEGGKGEITPEVDNVSTTKDSDVSNNVKDAIAKAIETGKGTTGISDELAAAIKAASEAGNEITTGLVAEAKTEASLSKDTLDKFGTKLTKNSNVLGYYDVNLYVYSDGVPLGKITDLAKSLKVTLNTKALVANLPKVKTGKVRRFYVIQIHNDKVTKKAAALNSDNTLSFDANGFSDYAVIYEDVDKTTTNPNTNDDITMYASMLTLSSLGLSIIIFNKKRLN